MFNVSRFGGFSNPPKNDGQRKIDQLLLRVKSKGESDKTKKRRHPEDSVSVSVSVSESGTGANVDGSSAGDSEDTHALKQARRQNDALDSASGSDSDSDTGDTDSGSNSDSNDVTSAQADEKKRAATSNATTTSSGNQTAPMITSNTLQIARAMMHGNTGRSNLLRKLKAPAGPPANAMGVVVTSSASTGQRKIVSKQDAAAAQAATWDILHPVLQKAAKAKGLKQWFPIQTASLPTIVGSLRHPTDKTTGSDFCIAAPTGSGKTLAYVLPVLQALIGRRVTRLRALIILPTRDLAMQVRVRARVRVGVLLPVCFPFASVWFSSPQLVSTWPCYFMYLRSPLTPLL